MDSVILVLTARVWIRDIFRAKPDSACRATRRHEYRSDRRRLV